MLGRFQKIETKNTYSGVFHWCVVYIPATKSGCEKERLPTPPLLSCRGTSLVETLPVPLRYFLNNFSTCIPLHTRKKALLLLLW